MYECVTPQIVPKSHLQDGDDRDVYTECGKCSTCVSKRERILLVRNFAQKVKMGYLIQ